MSIGNEKSNKVWEGVFRTTAMNVEKPTSLSLRSVRETYIINKYVKKLYIDNEMANEGGNPLILMRNAVERNQPIEIVRILVTGFDINSELDRDNGMTALHIAVILELPECVELLCQFNASIEKRNLQQESPLDLAHANASASENPTSKLILETLLHHLKATSSY